MTVAKNITLKRKRPMLITEALISLGIFFLALMPRAYELSRFVTADEAKWVYRSARFLATRSMFSTLLWTKYMQFMYHHEYER